MTELNSSSLGSAPSQDSFEELLSRLSAAEAEEAAHLERLEEFRNNEKYKAFIGWLNSEYRKAADARDQVKRTWVLNYGFYRGNQSLKLAPLDARMGPYAGRVAKLNQDVKSINRIRPLVRTEMAKLVGQKPSAYVVPASSDDDDLFAAYAGEQVWEHQYSDLEVLKHFTRAAFWLSIAGNGFMKTWWDPTKDDGLGDVAVGAVTPFNIFVPDVMEPDIEDQPWVIHAYTKPIEWVKQVYAKELEGHDLSPTESMDADLKASIEDSFRSQAKAFENKPKSVLVKEVWLKPGAHELFPNGGMATFVSDIAIVAFTEGLPYEHGMFPFIKFDHLSTDTFYSDSTITDVRELQVAYNSIRHRIHMSIKKSGLNTLVAPKGSVVASKITNEIGQVIYYQPGLGVPQPINVSQIPGHYFDELNRIIQDIEDISGQHEVSRGTAPTGVTAATAISFLQEQDDNLMTTTYQNVEMGVEKLAKQVLSLCVQYWDTPRAIKVTGSSNSFDTHILRGADIKNGTDVRIEGGSALPQSRAARQALIMDLMGQGILDPNEGLKLLEIGGAQRIVDQLREDERQAQRENIKMKSLTPEDIEEYTQMFYMYQGIDPESLTDEESGNLLAPPPMVMVNTWDNHEVHIEVHNRFRKSQAFDYLPDEVKRVFETHVEMHKQVMMQESIEEFMSMIPSDGTLDNAVDPQGANPEELQGQGPLQAGDLMGGAEGSPMGLVPDPGAEQEEG